VCNVDPTFTGTLAVDSDFGNENDKLVVENRIDTPESPRTFVPLYYLSRWCPGLFCSLASRVPKTHIVHPLLRKDSYARIAGTGNSVTVDRCGQGVYGCDL
jgi:hypothetical protein